MKLTVREHIAPLQNAFSISRGTKTEAKTLIVELQSGPHRGRGECVPYPRYGESVASVSEQISKMIPRLQNGLSRDALQDAMPAGAARCAIDCALWDLEAKRQQRAVWQLAGLPEPKPVETAITISLDLPQKMATQAARADGKLLKLKLGSQDDLARLKAVHEARPDARLVLDGNEGLEPEAFEAFSTLAADLGAVLIEQPFPAADDQSGQKIMSSVAVCADESAHTSADIPALSRIYDAVNVKLDKTGGLTEAIKMVQAARAANMKVMIGCMVAGSLSMAPAVLLAGLADIADLDGPIWLAEDIEGGLTYQNGFVHPPMPQLWG